MAHVRKEAYTGASGKPIYATVDVTPTWWPRKRRTCYGPVAAVVAKFEYSANFTIGLAGVSVEALLVKDEDFGASVEALGVALEELGSEWAEPRPVFETDTKIVSYSRDELTVG